MNTWLIIVVAAVVLLALAFWRATRGRERRLESRRTEEPEVTARDELARGAGVASFGLNLPWRRARRDSSR
jgi:hypothetical protein